MEEEEEEEEGLFKADAVNEDHKVQLNQALAAARALPGPSGSPLKNFLTIIYFALDPESHSSRVKKHSCPSFPSRTVDLFLSLS